MGTTITQTEARRPLWGPFEVRAVAGFDDGSWWWELYADGDFLDGGPIASDAYPTAVAALDMAEHLIGQSIDAQLVRGGITPWRRPDLSLAAENTTMVDPRDTDVAVWRVDDSHGFASLVVATAEDVTVYARHPHGGFDSYTRHGDEFPMWPRLWPPSVAGAPKTMNKAMTTTQVEAVYQRLAARPRIASTITSAPAPADVSAELALINRHRRSLGMRPLDPVAAGWTDEDVRIEATSLRARGINPRAQLLSW